MLLQTTSDNEMTQKKKKKKKKKVYIINFCYFQIYIYKLQIVQNSAQLSLMSHPCFLFIEILEAIKVDKH
jgi:hypothetical protein